MNVYVSDSPVKDAAAHVSSVLRDTKIPTLVLLPGGSALKIFEHIDAEALGPHQTFMMGDERCSSEQDANNFLQFAKTKLYTDAIEKGALCPMSVPTQDDVGNCCVELRDNMEASIRKFLDENREDRKVLSLQGIGADGHTAGILPLADEMTFSKTYQDPKQLYTTITVNQSTFKARVSITLTALELLEPELVLYAVGEEKCEVLRRIVNHPEAVPVHQFPALHLAQFDKASVFTDQNCT